MEHQNQGKGLQTNQEKGITQHSNKTWLQIWKDSPVTADSMSVEIFKQNTPAISTIGERGPAAKALGIEIFKAQVISIIEFFGVDWSDEQIQDVAELSYDEHFWLSLAELKLFVKKVKAGKYQSNKNFNPPIFMEFINTFSNEIISERGAYFGQQKKDTTWVEPENPVSDAKFAQLISEVSEWVSGERKGQEEAEELKRKRVWEENQQRISKLNEINAEIEKNSDKTEK